MAGYDPFASQFRVEALAPGVASIDATPAPEPKPARTRTTMAKRSDAVAPKHSKAMYETFVVRLGQREGKRYADRAPLNVHYHLAVGQLEELSRFQLRETANDLLAELRRRDREQVAS